MLTSLRFRSLIVAAAAAGCLLVVTPAHAQTWAPWPQTPLSGPQLSASAAAASKHGVPLNIVRGVTTYLDGPTSSAADFDREATRLAWWYQKLYPRFGGSALVNWTRAAAAEMGKGVSPLDVARATANQQVAINTILAGPFWATVVGFLPEAAGIGAAAPGEVGIGGAAASPAGGAAAGAGAGGSAAGKAASGLADSGSSAGSPASALSTAPMAALAGAATIFLADHVSSDTQVNLTGGWFQQIYRAIENYAWMLAVIALITGAIWIMLAGAAGQPTGIGLLFFAVPKAALLMIMTPVLAMVGIAIVDGLCADLVRQFPQGLHMLHAMAGVLGALGAVSVLAGVAGHASISHFAGTGAWLIGAFGLVTSGAVALELIAREIAIYLTVLIVPLALVGEIFGPFHKWATTLMKVLFAVIVTKLLLAIGLTLAGVMIMTGVTHLSPVLVIVAIVTIGLMTLFPVVVYGALLRVESAWHTTVQTGIHAGPSHSLARQVRQAHNRVQARYRPTPESSLGPSASLGTQNTMAASTTSQPAPAPAPSSPTRSWPSSGGSTARARSEFIPSP